MAVCPQRTRAAIKAAWHESVSRPETLGLFVVSLECRRQVSVCDFCGFQAETKAGLAAHVVFKHQIRSAASRITVCPCCDTQFHTRARLQYHLRKTAKYCLRYVRAEGLLVDKDTAALLDEAEALRLRNTRSRAVEDVRPVLRGVEPSTGSAGPQDLDDEIFLEDVL